MRRTLTTVAAALTTVLTATLGATPTATADTTPVAPTIDFTWPTTSVELGSTATLTVTGHNLPGITRVYLFTADHYPDDTFEGFHYINPDDPATTFTLTTTQPATLDYIAVVGGVQTDPDFIARSDYTLTVTGINSQITATIPTGPYETGQNATITGKVTGTPKRPVMVQHLARNNTWVTLTTGRTRKDKTFTLPVPTWWATNLHLRVYAPATTAAGETTTEQTTDVTVTRHTSPRPGTDYTFTDPTTQPRWDPCTPITYRVNRTKAPTKALTKVRRAFNTITQATGLRFTYAGRTQFVPLAKTNKPGARARHTNIVVAWATPKLVPALKRHTGRGGSTQRIHPGDVGELTYGWAVLNRNRTPTNPTLQAKILLHNLTHTVGLGNVTDQQQVMAETSRVTPLFGAGDLAGLAEVGADKGCFPIFDG